MSRDGTQFFYVNPLEPRSRFDVAAERWCEVRFEPVTTTSLRLSVKLRPDWAAGAHEWKVTSHEE